MATKAGPNIITDGLVLNIDPANVKSYPAKNDPYRDQVSLLLDGASFTDKSRNNFTVTTYGNAQIVSDSTFGSVMSFDGNGDFISIPDNSVFGFGTGDFTLEAWVKLNSPITATSGDPSYKVIINKFSAGSNGTEDSFMMLVNNASGTMQITLIFISNTTTTSFTFNIPNVDTQLNSVWNHITAVRQSGSIKVYFNGSQIGTTQTYTSSINQGTLPVLIGARIYNPYDLFLNGLIGPLRIVKGAALYTSNFTPPLSFSAPTRITDTKGKSVGTLTNGPVFSNVQNGAISFDGAGDYLDFPSSESFNFSSNNFCIESWIYLNQYPVNNNGYYSSMIICKDQISNRSWDFLVTGTSSANTTLQFTGFINNSSIQQANISYAFNLNTWYHVACSRVGNYIYLYVNGICINPGGTSFTATIQNTSSVVRIGAQVYSTYYYYFNGNIANLKVYKDRGLSASEVEKNYTATRKRFVETPKTIPGLQLWLDGADLGTMRQNSNGTTAVAVNGDPVGYWGDKSGNGRHAIQATAGNRPLFYIDSAGAYLNLDGASSVLTGSWPLTLSEETVYIILSLGSGGYTYGRVFTQYNTTISANDWNVIGAWIPCLRWSSTTLGGSARVSMSPAVTSITSNTISLDTNYIYGAFNDGFYNTSQINNNSLAIGDNSGVTHNNTYNTYAIGREPNYNGYVKGKVREIIVFNRFLSDSERAVVKNYLNKKWNVF